MKKEFVSYEQAVALKELGIYISPPCYSVYRKYNNINAVLLVRAESMETIDLVAPLKQQVFKWFREKYGLDSMIQPTYSTKYQFRIFKKQNNVKSQLYGEYMGTEFNTYEEAEDACIDKLIELAKLIELSKQQDNETIYTRTGK